ncbi:MAG: hypothetical protein IJX17_04055, partial [Clostridia bacterium]|nr:hypothetical protein [Clostridia bacterium]
GENEFYYSPTDTTGKFNVYSSDFATVYEVNLATGVSEADAFESFDTFKQYITKAYSFVGWYVQYFNESSGYWSEMTCMSREIYRPFVTVANANTNIVAIFSELTQFSITYSHKELNISFDVSFDSRGARVEEIVVGDTTTLSGWFYFTSAPTVLVSPAGGYRIFDSFEYYYNNNLSTKKTFEYSEITESLHPVQFLNPSNTGTTIEPVDFDDISLTNVTYMRYNFNHFLKYIKENEPDASKRPEKLTSLNITFKSEFLVLTYIQIEGFCNNDATKGFVSSELYLSALNLETKEVEELFISVKATDLNGHYTFINDKQTLRDSANNEIEVTLNGKTLIIFGYFDYKKYNGTAAFNNDTTNANEYGDLIGSANSNKSNNNKYALIVTLKDGVTVSSDPTSASGYEMWYVNKNIEKSRTKISTSTIPAKDRDFVNSDSSVIYFYDYNKPGIYNTAETNHFMHLRAVTCVTNTFVVESKFYEIGTDSTLKEVDTPNVSIPVNIAYNTSFKGASDKLNYSNSSTVGTNGTFTLYFANESNANNTYINKHLTITGLDAGTKFTNAYALLISSGGSTGSTDFVLNVSIPVDYSYVNVDDNSYYMYVGYRIGNDTTIHSGLAYEINELMGSTLTFIYVRIQKIQISISAGSNYTFTASYANVSADSADEISIKLLEKFNQVIPNVTNTYRTLGLANRYTKFSSYTPSTFDPTNSTAKYDVFNYFIYGSDVTIETSAQAGYTFRDMIIKKNGADFETITTSNNSEVKYNLTNVKEYYEIEINYTFRFIVTMKQYIAATTSDNSFTKLYTKELLTFINSNELLVDTTFAYLDLVGQAYEASTHMQYQKLEVAARGNLFIYFFLPSKYKFNGIFANGIHINNALVKNKPVDGLSGFTLYYLDYDLYNAEGVTSDLSLEVRFTEVITIKARISGIDKKDGVYPFDEILDASEMSNSTTTLGKTIYNIFEINGQVASLTNETNEAGLNNTIEGIPIAINDTANFKIATLPTSEFTFSGYFFYQKFQAELLEGNKTGIEPQYSWYKLSYFGSECYFTDDPKYGGLLYNDTDIKSGTITNENAIYNQDDKMIYVERNISTNPITELSITSDMLESLENATLYIYAKFVDIIKIKISRSIDTHQDDFLYSGANQLEFLNKFDSLIIIQNKNGEETKDNISIPDHLDASSFEVVDGKIYKIITAVRGSKVNIYPYITPDVEHRYTFANVTYPTSNGSGLGGIYLINGAFTINTSNDDLMNKSEVIINLEVYPSYNITVEKTINGETRENTNSIGLSKDEKKKASVATDLQPLVSVLSTAYYADGLSSVSEVIYLSGEKPNANSSATIYDVDSKIMNYPLRRKPGTSDYLYTRQELSTYCRQITSLVFNGWYLNGFLYSTDSNIVVPFSGISTESNGYVIIYNPDTNVILDIASLIYVKGTTSYYSFTYTYNSQPYTYNVSETTSLQNFYGTIEGIESSTLSYVYMPSDNIKLTASYSTYAEVAVKTDTLDAPENNENLVNSTITGNLLGVTCTDTDPLKDNLIENDKYQLIMNTNDYRKLQRSKAFNSPDYKDLDDYRLTSTISSTVLNNTNFENTTDVVYALNGSNLIITGGHIIGYRVTHFTFVGTYVKVSKDALGFYNYETKEISFVNEITAEDILGTGAMGYISLGTEGIFESIQITAHYEMVYQISLINSTIGDYDDNAYTGKTGGSVDIHTHVRGEEKQVSDGTFYSETYEILNVTVNPEPGYTFIGLYANAHHLLDKDNPDLTKSINLTEEIIGFDIYGFNQNSGANKDGQFKIDITEGLKFIGENRRDIILEAKFAKNIDFSVRLSIENTNYRDVLEDSFKIYENHPGFDVDIKMSSIYNSVVYSSGISQEIKKVENVEKSIWDITYTKVKAGDVYDPSLKYSTAESNLEQYIITPEIDIKLSEEAAAQTMPYTRQWELKDGQYIATEFSNLFVVDDKYLLLNFEVAYGTKVDLSVLNTLVEGMFKKNESNGFDYAKMYFNGWYLYRQNQLALSTSIISYAKDISFYASEDYYGSTIDIVAKYSFSELIATVTTTKTVSFVDEASSFDESKDNSLTKVELAYLENYFKVNKNANNIYTHTNGNKYMFAGWWQVITDATRPSTYLLISNSFNDDLPQVNMLEARFVRLKPITVDLPQNQSGYYRTNMFYRYYYTQYSRNNDIRVHNYTTTAGEKLTHTLYVPIDTYLGSTTIYSSGGITGGFYFEHANTTNDTSVPFDDLFINNNIGVRYKPKSIDYVIIDSVIYYVYNDRLYTEYIKTPDEIYVDESTEVDRIDGKHEYKITSNQLEVYVGTGLNKVTIPYGILSASYIVYNSSAYFINGRYLYKNVKFTEVEADGKYTYRVVNGVDLNYVVSNNIVIIKDGSQASTSAVTIEKVYKLGYQYEVNSSYNLFSLISEGFTISYIITTIEEDGSYGATDGIIGGTILNRVVRSKGGSKNIDAYTYSSSYPILDLKLQPSHGYTFIGLYVNGIYVENSYNNLNLSVDISSLKGVSNDVVVEVKFAKNVTLEYRISVDNIDTKTYIYDELGLKSIMMEGVVNNIYNSVRAEYLFGDKIYSGSLNINDITIIEGDLKGSFVVSITVPYGTYLNFGTTYNLENLMKDGLEKNNRNLNYYFNGWYLYENNDTSLSNTLVSTEQSFTVYAVQNANTNLKFVAKYSTKSQSVSISNTPSAKLYYLNEKNELETTVLEPNVELLPIMKDNAGRTFMFTGWWQKMGNTEMLISNMLTGVAITSTCEARYIQIVDFIFNCKEPSSISVNGYLHQAYSYPQSTTVSNPTLSVKYVLGTDEERGIVVTTTIFSTLSGVNIKSLNGYYFRNEETGEYDETDTLGPNPSTPQYLSFFMYKEGYTTKYFISSN